MYEMMCERVVVVLWAGWIGKSVWCGDQEMIVGDMDGNVRSKFRERATLSVLRLRLRRRLTAMVLRASCMMG